MHGLGCGVSSAQAGQRLLAVLVTGTGQQVMVLPCLLFLLPASFSTKEPPQPRLSRLRSCTFTEVRKCNASPQQGGWSCGDVPGAVGMHGVPWVPSGDVSWQPWCLRASACSVWDKTARLSYLPHHVFSSLVQFLAGSAESGQAKCLQLCLEISLATKHLPAEQPTCQRTELLRSPRLT